MGLVWHGAWRRAAGRMAPWLALLAAQACALPAWAAPAGPDCSRPLSLALHDHGLLYSADTSTGIDKDVADELVRRSACKIHITLMPRARIWQLIESGALDFSLSGIASPERERFASFAWYFSNKYYLLVRREAKVEKLEDFQRQPALQLGVIRGFRYSDSANRFVDGLAEQQRVTQSSGLSALFAALSADQIQAMIIEPFDYPALDSAPIRARTRIVEFGDKAVLHGLIMSRTSLSETEQAKWRALIDAMRQDGTMLRIFKQYFKPDLARAMVTAL